MYCKKSTVIKINIFKKINCVHVLNFCSGRNKVYIHLSIVTVLVSWRFGSISKSKRGASSTGSSYRGGKFSLLKDSVTDAATPTAKIHPVLRKNFTRPSSSAPPSPQRKEKIQLGVFIIFTIFLLKNYFDKIYLNSFIDMRAWWIRRTLFNVSSLPVTWLKKLITYNLTGNKS